MGWCGAYQKHERNDEQGRRTTVFDLKPMQASIGLFNESTDVRQLAEAHGLGS